MRSRPNEVVIVVDMWENMSDVDIETDMDLPNETIAFGVWLNYNLTHIRKDFNIIHVADGKDIMDQIDTYTDTVKNEMWEIPNYYDKYYICGMHLGRCTHGKAMQLMEHVEKDKIGIVFNLSLLFPTDDYNRMRTREWFTMYNYVRGIKGFTRDCAPKELYRYSD